MRYIPLFVAIQLVSLVLVIFGVPIVGLLAYFYAWEVVATKFQWRGGYLTWIYGNLEDGIVGPGMAMNRWNAFYWSSLRNPCNNLRYVPGVSNVGRPLRRVEWTMLGKPYYGQAGWNSRGFPVLSAGFNIHAGAA